MFHQTTLDTALLRAAATQRRAALRAARRPLVEPPRDSQIPCCPSARPATCCA